MAEDLASKLRDALRYAHAHWASLQNNDQLAARTSERDLDLLGVQQAVAGETVLQLSLPVGRTITVTLGEEDYRSPKRGWTTVRSDSELLDATVRGADHLAIKDALDTIAELLTAHLREDAFLGMDEQGELYVVANWLARFGRMPQAMENLVLGVMPVRMPHPPQP